MNLAGLILEANDTVEELVDVPEWNVKLLIRSLTGAQREMYMTRRLDPTGKARLEKCYAELLIETVHDPETKKPVFERPHVDALGKKNGAVLDRLANIALRISGLTAESKAVMEKNSQGAASADSTSTSPEPSTVQ